MRFFIIRFMPGALVLGMTVLSACAAEDPIVTVLHQTDTNHDRVLSSAEVTAQLRRKLRLDDGLSSPELAKQQALFKKVFGPGPNYPVQDLAAHPYFNPKILAVEAAAPESAPDTVHLWVPKDEKPFKLRRNLDDFFVNEAAAKGALISYTNDFNAKSDQWAFHGIAGLNLIEKKNVRLGQSATGGRQDLDPNRDRGVTERWFIPSVQWDKVTTSRTNTDEIDDLISRLSTGFSYQVKDRKHFIIDGFRLNVSGTYATDSSGDRGVMAGELDITPFKDRWGEHGIGINSLFQQVWIFRLAPELSFHMEGGTVTDDAGVPALMQANDFLRIGGKFGLSVRFEQISGRFTFLKGLLIHTGLEYYVDVTGKGPDVDIFTSSADWALDDDGHYTLSVEYRNGRSALVLQRDNRITVGLGMKF